MPGNKQATLRRVYGIALSFLTVITGAALIIQSQKIYRSADTSPYTREKVIAALSQIAVLLILWLCAVIGGAIIWKIYPEEVQKPKASFSQSEILKRLTQKLPDGAMSKRLKQSFIVKTVLWSVCFVFGVSATVMTCVCVFNPSNYTPVGPNFDPTADMLAMLPKFLPWVACFFILAVAVTIYTEISAKNDVKEIKRILSTTGVKQNREEKAPNAECEKQKRIFTIVARCVLACAAVTLIVIGCFNGGAADVLEKAINICTECIGLG